MMNEKPELWSDVGKASQLATVRVLLLSLFVVSMVSLWVFRPALANGFVNWDDQGYVEELVRLGRFSLSSVVWMWTSLQPFYLQPVAWMTHLLDHQIWGLNPVGHHATNWFLHGVYVVLVGTLVWKSTGKTTDVRSPERLVMSVGIALVCGIHPLQVESVAWVSARNGLLCSMWMVAALCAYLQAVGGGETRPGWWWTAVVLHAIALLTKPFAVRLPLLMLAMDFFPLRRHERCRRWRLVAEKWLLFIFSALAAVGAVAAQAHLEGLVDYQLGARLLVASRGLVFYLWKLIWPAWLSPFYPLQSIVELRNAEFFVPLVICIFVTVVVLGQRNRAPLLAATWCSYVALLLPVCDLMQVGGQAVADRYAYLAMVPVLIAVSAGALWLWHDGLSLWNAVLTRFPNDPRANFNLAMALVGAGRLSEARPFAEHAVDFSDPRTPQLPVARATLGMIYLKTHFYNAAVEQRQRAIAADQTLWTARYNLACVYARLGHLSEAYEVLQELLATRPEYAALATRDGELAPLRNDPRFAERLANLVVNSTVK